MENKTTDNKEGASSQTKSGQADGHLKLTANASNLEQAEGENTGGGAALISRTAESRCDQQETHVSVATMSRAGDHLTYLDYGLYNFI